MWQRVEIVLSQVQAEGHRGFNQQDSVLAWTLENRKAGALAALRRMSGHSLSRSFDSYKKGGARSDHSLLDSTVLPSSRTGLEQK